MKSLSIILSIGLVSGQIGANALNVGGVGGKFGVGTGGKFGAGVGGKFGGLGNFGNLANFNLNLNNLWVGGLNLGKVDVHNQDAVVDAIQLLLQNFCLGNQLDRNNILGFGFNNDVDLFFQLAHLQQLHQQGFLNLGGIQNLFQKGQVLGGFNLGVFKREIEEARKTMKRTVLRRGSSIKPNCAQGNLNLGNVGGGGGLIQTGIAGLDEAAFTIATAANQFIPDPTPAVAEAAFSIATAPADADDAIFSIATADPGLDLVSSTASADSSIAVATATAAASVGSFSVIVGAEATAVASSTSTTTSLAAVAVTAEAQLAASAAPPAAATAAPQVDEEQEEQQEEEEEENDEVENLSDLTR